MTMNSSERLGRLSAILLTLALLAGCGGANVSPTPAGPTPTPDPLAGWIQYTPDDGSFTVRLPEEPQIQEQVVSTVDGDVTVTIYATQQPNGAVLVSRNELTPNLAALIDASEPQIISDTLDRARDGALSNLNGTLDQEKDIDYDNHAGRDIIFTAPGGDIAPGGELKGMARVLLVGHQLYQFLFLTTLGDYDQKTAQAFADSFELPAGQ
jgi:hypothetical protein